MLAKKHPAAANIKGYEALFTHLFDSLSAEEAELHTVIRGYTVHAILPANQAISKWLEEDIDFRTGSGKLQELAVQLNILASHLMLWHAKFRAWIDNNPKHALVYLADEKKHGLEFPHPVDDLVLNALREIGFPSASLLKVTTIPDDAVVADSHSQKMRSPAERFSIGWPWVNGQVVDTIDYSLAKIFLEACENLGGGRTNANLMRHGGARFAAAQDLSCF